jgi:hypothetical protein
VTTSFNTEPQSWVGPDSQQPRNAAIIFLGVALSGILALAGITFFALAFAFPLALTVVESVRVYVSPSDMALATQLAAIWPLYVVAAVGSFAASVVTLVKTIQHVDPAA